MLRTRSEHRRGSYASLSSSISLPNQVVRVGDAFAFSTRKIWLLCFGHAALTTTERVDYPYSLLLLYLYIWNHLYVPTVFARRRPNYSSGSDEYPLHNKRKVFVRGRIPSPNHEASIRPLDEYPPHNMGQVFVPWTNTLSRKWGKYSSLGRIPSPKHSASIHPMDEYPLQHMGQVFVRRVWTNTPTRNLGQVLARGRIVLIRRMDLSGIRQICSYSCGLCIFGIMLTAKNSGRGT